MPKPELRRERYVPSEISDVELLDQRPHLRPHDAEGSAMVVQHPNAELDPLEVQADADLLEGRGVRAVDRDIDLVDSARDEFPVVLAEVKVRAVRRHTDPYPARPRGADHRKKLLACEEGLAQAVELDLEQSVLLVK